MKTIYYSEYKHFICIQITIFCDNSGKDFISNNSVLHLVINFCLAGQYDSNKFCVPGIKVHCIIKTLETAVLLLQWW